MSQLVCNDCGSMDIVFTGMVLPWYNTLTELEGISVAVPEFGECERWLADHDVDDNLLEEKMTVVVDYWDPKKYKSPWGMLQRYILKELRLQSERTASPQSGGMLRGGARY